MGFVHIQGAGGNNPVGNTSLTFNIVLPSNPTPGNLVCTGIAFPFISSPTSLVSVVDGNGNTYTITPNSPSGNQTPAGKVYLIYLLNAPSNANKTLTVTVSTTGLAIAGWADEFEPVGGIALFHADAKANTATAGTTINTPSIASIGVQSLLYSCAAAGGTITHPVAGATLGVWTGAAGAITFGDMSEYELAAGPGTTAVDYTQTSGRWSAMAMSFSFIPRELALLGCGV